MINLKKKYTYNGDEVIDIHHYSESTSKLKYLVVIKNKLTGASSWWIAEDDPELREVKPEPRRVTRWFIVYKDLDDFTLDGAYLSENETKAHIEDSLDYITTIPITVEIPVEDE